MPRRAALALVVALAAGGALARAPESSAACASAVVVDDRVLIGSIAEVPSRLPPPAGTYPAISPACNDTGGDEPDQDTTVLRLRGLPPRVAVRTRGRPIVVYAANGSLLEIGSHPLHAGVFRSARTPSYREGRRCRPVRTPMRGRTVGDGALRLQTASGTVAVSVDVATRFTNRPPTSPSSRVSGSASRPPAAGRGASPTASPSSGPRRHRWRTGPTIARPGRGPGPGRLAGRADPAGRLRRGADRAAVAAAGAGLAVEPGDLPNAGERGAVAEGAVGAPLVVVAYPVWQRVASGCAGGVFQRVGPFALQGLLVALDLAVGAGRVGPGADVADRAAVEQFAQTAVVDVGERVVGHQPLGGDPVVEVEVQRAAGERGHGRPPSRRRGSLSRRAGSSRRRSSARTPSRPAASGERGRQ